MNLELNTAGFIQQLYRCMSAGYVAITYLAPEGAGLFPNSITHFSPLPLKDELDFSAVHAMNEKGYSVYFRVMVQDRAHSPEQRVSEKSGKPYTFYPRGKTAESIYTRVLWAEIDYQDTPKEQALERIAGLKITPSILVSSGAGLHIYFTLSEVLVTHGAKFVHADPLHPYPTIEVDPAELKRTLKGIAVALGGDVKVSELCRIMRLPGTINTKPGRNNALCEVIKTNLGSVSYRALEMEYAPLIRPTMPTVSRYIPPAAYSQTLPKKVQDYLVTGAATGERNQTLYYCARAYNDAGMSENQALAELSTRAAADGLDQHEIENTIRSAFDSASTPQLPNVMRSRMAAADKTLGKKKL